MLDKTFWIMLEDGKSFVVQYYKYSSTCNTDRTCNTSTVPNPTSSSMPE